MKSNYGERITIDVVQGGFILMYPVLPVLNGNDVDTTREVFVSPRKLQQKIKEVIDALSLVKEPS